MTGRKVIMNFEVTPTSHTLAAYRARGGYEALEKAVRTMQPADVTREVVDSGLQGRGGAAFPAGRKWQGINLEDGLPHYLIANADEGEPGTFKDRWVLEHTPHTLVESMLMASYALGVRHSFVYLRGEYDLPWRRLAAAVEEAYEAGYIGEHVLGSELLLRHLRVPRRRRLRLRRGLLAARLHRGHARLPAQPPAAHDGARPVPAADHRQQRRDAVEHRLDRAQRRGGLPRDRHAQEPRHAADLDLRPHPPARRVRGRARLPWVKFLQEDCGGVIGGRGLKAVIPGGISSQVLAGRNAKVVEGRDAKVVLANAVEHLTLDHESLKEAGSGMGSGGMIVIAEGTCMVRLLHIMLRFYHHESCGQCTPCREGMGWMHRMLDRIVAGEGRPEDIDTLYYVSRFNDGTTICGLGDAAGYAAMAILDTFRHEFEHFIEHKRSMYDGNLECRPSS
jgi:NADH-quinone oxidoreductase subunit F